MNLKSNGSPIGARPASRPSAENIRVLDLAFADFARGLNDRACSQVNEQVNLLLEKAEKIADIYVLIQRVRQIYSKVPDPLSIRVRLCHGSLSIVWMRTCMHPITGGRYAVPIQKGNGTRYQYKELENYACSWMRDVVQDCEDRFSEIRALSLRLVQLRRSVGTKVAEMMQILEGALGPGLNG